MSAAVFQSTVNFKTGFGNPGEIFNDGPIRSRSYILDSQDPTDNVFGRGFTIVDQNTAQAGNPTPSTFIVAGVLVQPKQMASFGGGTSSDPLNPTLTVPNASQVDILSMGSVIVELPAAANIGDLVVFDDITGILSTIAPGVSIPVGKTALNAVVDFYTLTQAGLAVITLSPRLIYGS